MPRPRSPTRPTKKGGDKVSAGKYLSLEEVRRNPRLIGRFIRERIAGGHGEGDEEKFESTLGSMVRTKGSASQTSSQASDEDCSETQTQPDSAKGTSGKRARASRE